MFIDGSEIGEPRRRVSPIDDRRPTQSRTQVPATQEDDGAARGPLAKGGRFTRILEVIKVLAPPERYVAMLGALPDDARRLILSPPLATDWIPAAVIGELLWTAHHVAYEGRIELVFEQGRLSFKRDVRSIYRPFVRFLSPSHVIGRAGQIFSTYYQNNGRLVVTHSDAGSLVVRYDDVAIGSPAFWAQSRGTIHGALEATGMKDVSTHIDDGGDDSSHCVIRAVWR